MLISPFSLIIMNEIEMNLCLKSRLVDTISTKTDKNLLAAIYGGLWCYSMITCIVIANEEIRRDSSKVKVLYKPSSAQILASKTFREM